MGSEKRGWRCWKWKRLLCALALVPVLLLGLNFTLRKRWIEPLPGVRVEPTRPVMRRSDFGPESPYMRLINLLVDMVEQVDGLSAENELFAIVGRLSPTLAPPDPDEIFGKPYPPPDEWLQATPREQTWWWGFWSGDQNTRALTVLDKFRHHPWPSMGPPPAPVPEPVYALPSVTLDYEDPFSLEGCRLHTKGIFHARDMLVGGETFGERDRFRVMWEVPGGGEMFGGVDMSGGMNMFGGMDMSFNVRYSLGTQEEGMPGKPLLAARTGKPIYRLPYEAFAQNAPWNLEQHRDVQRILEHYEAFFPRLDSILADPAARMPTVFYGEYDPSRSPIRTLCSWLAVAAQVKAGMGDWDEAFLCIDRILQLADMVCRGGGIPNHWVARRGFQEAMEAAWHIASRHPVPVPILRQAARDILAHADTAEPYVEAVRTDWLVAKSMVSQIYRDSSLHLFDKKRLRVRFSLFLDERIPSRAARLAFVILAPLMGSTPETSTRNLHACHQHLVVLAEQPYSAKSKAEYDNLRARLTPASETSILLGSRDPVGRVIADMIPLLRQRYSFDPVEERHIDDRLRVAD